MPTIRVIMNDHKENFDNTCFDIIGFSSTAEFLMALSSYNNQYIYIPKENISEGTQVKIAMKVVIPMKNIYMFYELED